MTKIDSYRGVKYTIGQHPNMMYGHYQIRANYKRTDIRVTTTDSEIYDYSGCNEFAANRNEARKTAYNLIRDEFERTSKG